MFKKKTVGTISQEQLIFDYYKKRPNQDIQHATVVDWAVKRWRTLTGKVLRDPDRAIRKLHQKGLLIKISKGVYRYEPTEAFENKTKDFSLKQKQIVLKRGDYKCIICGLGEKDGQELHIDHKKPLSKGGRSILSNAQILCGKHNYMKKITVKPNQANDFLFNYINQLLKIPILNYSNFA